MECDLQVYKFRGIQALLYGRGNELIRMQINQTGHSVTLPIIYAGFQNKYDVAFRLTDPSCLQHNRI